jgi:DNA repair protein radc
LVKDIEKLTLMKTNPHEGHRQRLRAKIDRDPEMETLEDHEALEFHLSLVIPRKDTNELAHELIRQFGSLDAVLSASPQELIKVKNMTVAASYMLASELSMVRKAMRAGSVASRSKKLSRPEDGIRYMHSYFLGRKTECFCVALLDLNYKLIRVFFTPGTSGGQIDVDASDIVLKATRDGAAHVLIAHNHPSGNVTPSFDDLEMTRRLLETLAAVGISLLDHVIFYEYDFFSFHNNGVLEKFLNDLDEKTKNKFKENPTERQLFLLDLNEYLIEPSKFVTDKIITRPKQEIIEDYEYRRKKSGEDDKA